MDRAFATLALKSLDEEKREFSGLATSPAPDRVLDIIEPLGCKYKNPTVLLRAHDHTSPIGSVTFDRPTKTGVGFRASIPKIQEPGLLKDRVDMAWGEIKHGLVRAVSVGFRPLESEPLRTGGIRFLKTEIYELSTVAVPAQELATIDHVKAIDAEIRGGRPPATVDAASSLSPLWRRIAQSGLLAMDQFERSEEGKQFGPVERAQLAGTSSLQTMVRNLCEHIDELEQRLTENPLRYRGVWKADQTFPAGSFVTFGGSMWFAEKSTGRRPGEGDWVLAVKHGRDGKDAK